MNGGKGQIVTESMIQNALYRHLRWDKSFIYIFPNMASITMYEADILAVTRSGYASEYEIKLSLSDFRADRKKREKHCSLSGEIRKIVYPYPWGKGREIYVTRDAPEDPYKAMRHECWPEQRPKYFWYVIHGFDVPEGELPDYAGLMRFLPSPPGAHRPPQDNFDFKKWAPKLDSRPVNPERIARATTNMLYRYWELRLKERTA